MKDYIELCRSEDVCKVISRVEMQLRDQLSDEFILRLSPGDAVLVYVFEPYRFIKCYLYHDEQTDIYSVNKEPGGIRELSVSAVKLTKDQWLQYLCSLALIEYKSNELPVKA